MAAVATMNNFTAEKTGLERNNLPKVPGKISGWIRTGGQAP